MYHVSVDRRQQGFTIVELAIVMVIVGALAGLAVPTYLGYLDKARLARCIAEIRYIPAPSIRIKPPTTSILAHWLKQEQATSSILGAIPMST